MHRGFLVRAIDPFLMMAGAPVATILIPIPDGDVVNTVAFPVRRTSHARFAVNETWVGDGTLPILAATRHETVHTYMATDSDVGSFKGAATASGG